MNNSAIGIFNERNSCPDLSAGIASRPAAVPRCRNAPTAVECALSVLMTRLSQLTARNLLIAIHDGLATAVALLLSYYLRFDGEPPLHPPFLFLVVPSFVALGVVVCFLFDLTTSKWRFVSVPDVFNILRVATVLSLTLVAFDYILVAPNVNGAFFFGKKAILLFCMTGANQENQQK